MLEFTTIVIITAIIAIKIISKKNEGVSCARNEGIKYINGEFVIFIDSDDYLEKNMLEKLYFYANNYEADMVICNYNMVEDNNIVHRKNEFNYNGILEKEEFFKKIFMPQYFSGYLWNKLIKSDIIIKNSIPLSPQQFPPNNPLKGPPPQQFLASSLHPHPLLSSCMFLPPFLLYIV